MNFISELNAFKPKELPGYELSEYGLYAKKEKLQILSNDLRPVFLIDPFERLTPEILSTSFLYLASHFLASLNCYRIYIASVFTPWLIQQFELPLEPFISYAGTSMWFIRKDESICITQTPYGPQPRLKLE